MSRLADRAVPGVFAALLTAAPLSPVLAHDPVEIVSATATVSGENWGEVGNFLLDSADKVVRLNFAFLPGEDGALTVTFSQSDGFSAFGDTGGDDPVNVELTVEGGVNLQSGALVVEGDYVATFASATGGVLAVHLHAVPTGAVFLSGASIIEREF